MGNYRVIDGDAHHHEPPYLWQRYVEPAFQERAPKVIGLRRNFFVYAPETHLPGVDIPPPPPSHDKFMADKYGDAYDAWWSPEIRLRDMDRFGWDIQVILSTNANRVMEVACREPDLGLAMARAYHNWCHEYNSADPKRLKFTATLPAGDTPSMVEEARRAVEDQAPYPSATRCCRRASSCTSLNTRPCGGWPATSTSPSRCTASTAIAALRRSTGWTRPASR